MPSFDDIRAEMTTAARLNFTEFLEEFPDHTFYAFALYTASGADGGAMGAANSEEQLVQIRQSYIDQGYGDMLESNEGHFRYCPDEWDINGAGQSMRNWLRVTKLVEEVRKQFPPMSSDFMNTWMETMILSLEDLDKQGFFAKHWDREKITAVVWLEGGEKWWVRSAKRINPSSVFENFLNSMTHPREQWIALLAD